MSTCCCGLGSLLRSLCRSSPNNTNQFCPLTAKKYSAPVQCTDHDEPQVLKRTLGREPYPDKTTAGLQLKRVYMIYE
ncbi:hypothetical protein ACROYT_G003839 [Oculina patagonica]